MKQTNPHSIANYENKIKPELNVRQKEIYDLIKKFGELTSNDVAIYLNVRLNTISGRFSELRDSGKIKVVGRRSGFAVYAVVQDPGIQLTIG
jgi:predicted transcriptional regulator